MSTRIRTLGAGSAAVLLLALTACSAGEDGAGGSGAPADGPPTFAFITGDISDFGQVQIEGMESVTGPLGGSITVFDGGTDPESQNADCMDVVSSGKYNGIILNANSGPGAVPCVNAARDAGIPVAGIETVIGPDETNVEPQVEGVVVSAASSLVSAAEATADLLEEACANLNPCRYIHIVGSQAYQLEAVKLQVLEERFTGTEVQRVALGEDGYNPEKGRQVVGELLAANPDVDVVLNATDSTAVQVVDLLAEQERDDVIVLGDGASRQGVAAIKDGTMYGTVRLVPFTFGEVAAQALVDSLGGDEVITPAEVAELVTPIALTRANIEGVEGQWG